MFRVVTNLVATAFLVASMAAAPVPDQPKTLKAPPATTGKKQSRTTKRRSQENRPYQVGMASWYGKQFHGRATASGEDFDMFELTAAHRQLPLGTYVRVTNLRNGKSVVVRVNDRGPYVGDRILDLSYSAARLLNFRSGVERVRLDLVRSETLAQATTN